MSKNIIDKIIEACFAGNIALSHKYYTDNILSNLDVYNVFFNVLSSEPLIKNKRIEFILDGLSTLDKETVLLAAIDATMTNLDIELYSLLVDEFNVNTSLFQMRIASNMLNKRKIFLNTDRTYVEFIREIKLRSLLDDK